MLYLVVSFLVPILIGFTFVSLLWPTSLRSHFLLRFCLAGGTGFGIFSLLVFLFLLLFGASSRGLLLAEMVLLVSIAGVLAYKIGIGKPHEGGVERAASGRSKISIWLAIVFLLAFASSIVAFIFITLKIPHGDWDAWAIQNMRARFLFRAGEQWRDAYSAHLAWAELDYPLMVPASVAGCWRLIGRDTVLVPISLAMLFTFATVGLATSSLAVLRSRSQGYLGGLILLCTPFLIRHGASQYADVPLGFFFLATIVLLNVQARFSDGGSRLLALAGFSAGLAAWTKNEGQLFVVVVLIARFAAIVPKQGLKIYVKQTLRMAVGLLPVLLVLIYFKIRFAPATDFLTPREQSTLSKILDVSRYSQIFVAFKYQALGFGGWAVSILALLVSHLLLLGVRVERRERSSVATSAITLALMMAGYFAIFVITPRDLGWHLKTAVDRLFLQLFPCFVFLCFMLARTPEQAIAERQHLIGQATAQPSSGTDNVDRHVL